MIDNLPAEQFDAAAHAIWLLTVPEDDEPTTEADLAAIAAGREAYRRGETISDEDLRRELGL
jgi:hypothetical protein